MPPILPAPARKRHDTNIGALQGILFHRRRAALHGTGNRSGGS